MVALLSIRAILKVRLEMVLILPLKAKTKLKELRQQLVIKREGQRVDYKLCMLMTKVKKYQL